MPITDNLVVQHLLQLTETQSHPLLWRESEAGGYESDVQGLMVRVDKSYSSTGSRLFLLLLRETHTVYISEPLSISFWRPRYKSTDEEDLAHLLKTLLRSIERQCADRRRHDLANGEELRQQMYQQLLFGVGGELSLDRKSQINAGDSGNVTKVL